MSVEYWQNLPLTLDPVLFAWGGLEIRYYGLFYAASFMVAYSLVMLRLKTEGAPYASEGMQNFFVLALLGAVLGARIFYVLFYDFNYFLNDPVRIFLPFDRAEGHWKFTGISGLSFHGGFLGVGAVIFFYCRQRRLPVLPFVDFLIPAVPLGYALGRLGNFFNSELYGRVTTMPWGMIFPAAPTAELRHPSQLYEAFFEGVVLFGLLWSMRRSKVPGRLLAVYCIGYGGFRFLIEFVRQPDPQVGFVWGWLTLGQVLCLLMVILGAALLRRGGNPRGVS